MGFELNAQRRNSLILLVLLAIPGLVLAQEEPEISGTWNIVLRVRLSTDAAVES